MFFIETTTISVNVSCFFFWGIGASLNTILFFSHLFRVISPDNLSPHQGTLFLLDDFLRHAVYDVNPRQLFSQKFGYLKKGTCST